MDKTKPADPRRPATTVSTGDKSAAKTPPVDNTRETIESIIIALILAFLFRTFEAEAFEIPTGSMGPTLLGRNKDVECPKCGFPFQAGVSFEVNDFGQPLYYDNRVPQFAGKQVQAQTVTCPQCRYVMSVDPQRRVLDEILVKHPYSYSGDRIWVSKAPYVVHDPRRWDVAVFKYPHGANQNYIKRIVGLPREKVMIHRGNVYVSPHEKDDYQVARKPPHKVLATLQPVYDTDYDVAELHEKGWPVRWQPLPTNVAGAAWKSTDTGRTFEVEAVGEQPVWIGYRHTPPNPRVWNELQASRVPPGFVMPPQLICDFCPYNSATKQVEYPEDSRFMGLHWVGDLSLECELDVQSDQGEVIVALVEGGRLFEARFDVATGGINLAIDGLENYRPQATSGGIKVPGRHRVRFANVDDQLLVWVDENVVEFSEETAYPELGNQRPTVEDLTPARIGARGAKLKVVHLNLKRDIYYIASGGANRFTDFTDPWVANQEPADIEEFLSNPAQWDVFTRLSRLKFDLHDEQFLALGDNSPSSSDSRFWPDEHFVSRELIIGKAFYVYWPHAWETNPNIPVQLRGKTIRLPFYPNFWEMRLIR